MAKVNPIPLRLPSGLDPMVAQTLKDLNQAVFQLRERTGGGDDYVSNNEQSVNAEDSRKFVELRNLTRKVATLEMANESLRADLSLLRQQLKPKQQEEISDLTPMINRLKQKISDLEHA